MKAIFSFLTTALCAISPVFAQAPAIQWQNTIGGNNYDILYSVQQTADGGYILGGESNSNISADKTENSNGGLDYWVLKLDVTGAIQWQNTIGGNSDDNFRSMQQTADGGYILGGYSASNISGDKTENNLGQLNDYWVIKLDSAGAIQWQNTIGGNKDDFLLNLQQTADGGYILGGASNSNISGDKTENSWGGSYDYWAIKLDSTGAIQWQNTIGGDGGDFLVFIQQTADGGYILGGGSESNISGDKTENSWGGSYDYWVVKLDATGDIQWQNTIGGNAEDGTSSLQQTADGGYIIGGYSASDISGDKTENSLGNNDYWVVKLNASGAIQWQNTIGGNGREYFRSLQQTADGGYILGGESDSNISGDKTENSLGGSDYWVLKLDATGTIQWQNTIGGSSTYDEFRSLQQTADKGYILSGISDSNISGDKTENCLGGEDYWVIKLAPETLPTEEAHTSAARVTMYPNPATDAVFVQTDTEITLSLYNAIGQLLLAQTFRGNGKIELSSLPNGIYFLVEMETGIGHKILKN